MAIAPSLEASRLQATADLLEMLGWSQVGNVNVTICNFSDSQVALLTEERVAEQLGEELARARICLLHWFEMEMTVHSSENHSFAMFAEPSTHQHLAYIWIL